MNIEELTQLVVNALEDVKAKDIKVFNTEGLTDQFERVVIASGTSNRQTRRPRLLRPRTKSSRPAATFSA